MTTAKVEDSSGVQYSNKGVDDSPDDPSDRASQLKVLIELEICECISAINN